MIEKTVRMSLLFDFYGQLLTERQREFFSLYYDNDLSLGEIAAQYGVSRQAVYDILRRSTQTLCDLEEKLELVKGHEAKSEMYRAVLADLDALEAAIDRGESQDAKRRLDRVRTTMRRLQENE